MIEAARQIDAPMTPQAALALFQEIAAIPQTVVPRQVDKPLYIYGAGELGKLAWDYFKVIGIDVAAVLDANPARYGDDPFWSGVTIKLPSDIAPEARQAGLLSICVATFSYGAVSSPLEQAGWRDIVPFYTISSAYTQRHPLNNGWFTGPFSEQDRAGIADVLSRYADDASRAFHLQFIAWHALQQEWEFSGAEIKIDNRYFIPEVVGMLHDHECLVDLGAHHGKVIPKFLKLVDNKLDRIVAVEPDAINAGILRQSLCRLSPALQARSSVVQVALSSTPGTVNFFDGIDYASRICDYGTAKIDVHTLDSLGLAPTFLKVHVEGEELACLLGGLQTIRRHRPIIAATLYHSRLGLWEAQQRLMCELDGLDYDVRFRLHGWHGTGAVLYLLPRNRPSVH